MAGRPTEDLTRDPGWSGVWRSAGIITHLGQPLGGRKRRDPVVVMRRVFLGFSSLLVVLAFVPPLFGVPGEGDGAARWAVLVAAVGVGSLALSAALSRPLDASSDVALASSYQSRLFRRIALAEAPAIFGLVVAVKDPSAFWVYGVGCLFAVAGLVYAAPTRWQIEQDQERLVAAGSSRSLVFALRTQPAQLGRW